MSYFEYNARLAFEDAFTADPLTRHQAGHCAELAIKALIDAFGGTTPYIPTVAKHRRAQIIQAYRGQGWSVSRIARELGLSPSTVYRHLALNQPREP